MALRFPFPSGEYNFEEKEQLRIVPIPRDDKGVEFRKGEDLNALVDRYSGSRKLFITASPGSGKTTRLPLAFARLGPVIVCSPGQLLAYESMRWCREARGVQSVNVQFTQELCMRPRGGVTFMSYSCFLASVVAGGDFTGATLIADEAHESDAATYVVRSLGHTFSCDRFVQLSATPRADFEPLEAGVVSKVVDVGSWFAADPREWTTDDEGMPWETSESFAYYSDDVVQRQAASEILTGMGYRVFSLDGHSTVREFVAAGIAHARRDQAVVWIVDSTFRSGFSLPFDVIVDSGLIVEKGTDVRVRPISASERLQTRYRIGRQKVGNCRYFVCGKTSGVGFTLVGAEAEFAAFLFRVLGFEAPKNLANAVMSNYKVSAMVKRLKVWSGGTPLDKYCIGPSGPRGGAVRSVSPCRSEETAASPEFHRVGKRDPVDDIRAVRRVVDDVGMHLERLDDSTPVVKQFQDRVLEQLSAIEDKLVRLERRTPYGQLHAVVSEGSLAGDPGRTRVAEALLANFRETSDSLKAELAKGLADLRLELVNLGAGQEKAARKMFRTLAISVDPDIVQHTRTVLRDVREKLCVVASDASLARVGIGQLNGAFDDVLRDFRDVAERFSLRMEAGLQRVTDTTWYATDVSSLRRA